MKHKTKEVTVYKDVYTAFDGKEFEDEKEAKEHEEKLKDELRKGYNQVELLKEFESLLQDRVAFFAYDYADGYFIKVTGDGWSENYFKVADLKDTKHHIIEGAIQAAIDYFKKNNR